MAGLAVLLKAQGHDVSGCDLKATARTRWLETLGIQVSVGHDPAHLRGVDMVVVTPAVSADEPERLSAECARFRGEVLAEIVSNHHDSIAVCGSHGKTTTATWTAKLLRFLGEDPAWAIGGETGDFPVAGAGSGPLVVEADESDGTLALYRAGLLVVTNCEYDHPDHFATREDYFACYESARRNARDVVEVQKLPPLESIAAAIAPLAPHNRMNARAAAEVAIRRGHSPEAVAAALPSVVSELPDRRFQFLDPDTSRPSGRPRPSELSKPLFVTDYAHHPTEMACAVGMAREICRGTLRVLFQPHRYSRTKALLADFPAAFRLSISDNPVKERSEKSSI